MINKLLKTTLLFHFDQFVVKYLKDCFTVKCLTFLENDLIFYNSQVLDMETLVWKLETALG